MTDWRLTVGMEVHVELQTQTKLFCGCKNDPFHSAPNTNVCPVCYGLPGALPVLNKKAVEMTVKLGQALKGKIAPETFWARKNYFYPDLPKGYQISQSSAPLIENAVVTIDGQDHRIHRIHLEEDAGKLMHHGDYAGDQTGETYKKEWSTVNYNRAGVPLIEIVTEPDFDSAEAAKRFCQELQRILRSLEISSADMEKGLMRCEANISVSPTNSKSQILNSNKTLNSKTPMGTKVEVKNINSFRSVEKAIQYEFDRQTKALEAGETLQQETRTWDENNSKTVVMRTKETSADYRYFPEPDLPLVKIEIGEASVHQLPEERRNELINLGLPETLARTTVDKGHHNFVISLVRDGGKDFALEAAKIADAIPELAKLPDALNFLKQKKEYGWSMDTSKEIIRRSIAEQRTINELSGEYRSQHDLSQITKEVISENPKIIADYNKGNQNAVNALVGQVMKKTKGAANVAQARAELISQLQG